MRESHGSQRPPSAAEPQGGGRPRRGAPARFHDGFRSRKVGVWSCRKPKPWSRGGGQVHGAEPPGGFGTANRAVATADVAGDVQGDALTVGTVGT